MLDEIQERQERAIIGTGGPFGSNRSNYTALRYVRLSDSVVEVKDWKQRYAEKPSQFGSRPLSEGVVFAKQDTASVEKTRSAWLFDAILEIEKLPQEACGTEPPTSKTLSYADLVVRICADEGLSEPVIDSREGGAIEIFCKEENKGLLLVIGATGLIQIFGDFFGESWRARYELSGTIWPVHLRGYCREMMRQMPSLSPLARQSF